MSDNIKARVLMLKGEKGDKGDTGEKGEKGDKGDTGQPTDGQTESAVTKWLDNHPEATTTVQDKSLEIDKLTDNAKLYVMKDYATPQMFGAVGNANYFNNTDKKFYEDRNFTVLATDDTDAFIRAINSLKNGDTLYIPSGNYLISSSLSIVDKEIKIIGNILTRRNKGNENTAYLSFKGSVLKASYEFSGAVIDIGQKGKLTSVHIENVSIASVSGYSVPTGNIPNANNYGHRYTYEIYVNGVTGIRINHNTGSSNNTFSGVSVYGCSEYGFDITAGNMKFKDCYAIYCGVGFRSNGYDNLLENCYITRCNTGIICTRNTLFVYDIWLDEMAEYGIVFENVCNVYITGLINHCDYAGIKCVNLEDAFIHMRLNRCGCFYAGATIDEIPSEDYDKCCLIYCETAENNNISIVTQKRPVEDDLTGGNLPIVNFVGKFLNNKIDCTSMKDKKHFGIQTGNWNDNHIVVAGKKIDFDTYPENKMTSKKLNMNVTGSWKSSEAVELDNGVYVVTAYITFLNEVNTGYIGVSLNNGVRHNIQRYATGEFQPSINYTSIIPIANKTLAVDVVQTSGNAIDINITLDYIKIV